MTSTFEAPAAQLSCFTALAQEGERQCTMMPPSFSLQVLPEVRCLLCLPRYQELWPSCPEVPLVSQLNCPLPLCRDQGVLHSTASAMTVMEIKSEPGCWLKYYPLLSTVSHYSQAQDQCQRVLSQAVPQHSWSGIMSQSPSLGTASLSWADKRAERAWVCRCKLCHAVWL